MCAPNFYDLADEGYSVYRLDLLQELLPDIGQLACFRLFQLLLQLAILGNEVFDSLGQLPGVFQGFPDGIDLGQCRIDIGFRSHAADGFDTAYTGGDGAFMPDLEKAQLPGSTYMGAAAKFHRVSRVDDDYPDGIAVFFAK